MKGKDVGFTLICGLLRGFPSYSTQRSVNKTGSSSLSSSSRRMFANRGDNGPPYGVPGPGLKKNFLKFFH
jgi:hypothetical protein